MSERISTIYLWILGAGALWGLLCIGAAMLTDLSRHLADGPWPEDDQEDQDGERQEAQLPLG